MQPYEPLVRLAAFGVHGIFLPTSPVAPGFSGQPVFSSTNLDLDLLAGPFQ
jgi:hypothetical protein